MFCEQLATAALLIYSGFAALYYAKINPPSADDDEDFFLRRRRKRSHMQFYNKALFNIDPQLFQRIVDAIETRNW